MQKNTFDRLLKIIYIVGMPAIAAAIIFILYVAYLVLFPPKPPIKYEAPLHVTNSPIKQGQPIELNVIRCADQDTFVDANIEFLGPEIRTIDQDHYLIPKGCTESTSRNNIVPDDLTPGDYKLVIILFEQTDITHKYSDRIETETFTVIPK